MNFVIYPLTLTTFFPLLGVLIILFLKAEHKNAIRWVALLTSLVTFGISIAVLAQFDTANPDLQLVARAPWFQIANWTVHFYMAVDGLSILLVLVMAKKFKRNVLAKDMPAPLHAELIKLTMAYHPVRLIAVVQVPSNQSIALDLLDAEHRALQSLGSFSLQRGEHMQELSPVSYTHLTLPTIYSV